MHKERILRRIGFWFVVGAALLRSSTSFAQATFAFNVLQPQSGAIVGNQLSIQVRITSTYQLSTVTASCAGQTANLMFSSSASAWTNTLSLSGLTRGTNLLTVTAKDVFGNSGQTQSTFLKDLPPTLDIMEPRLGTVARPELQLDVTAADDDPAGAVINVYAGTNVIATGTNVINTIAVIPGNDGQSVDLTFEAVDSVGQTVSIVRTVYVFTGTNWQELARVEGPIFDVKTNTILFVDGNVLKTKSLDRGTEAVLLDNPAIAPTGGFLMSQGAIFNGVNSAVQYVYEVRGTNLLNNGQGQVRDVQGNYALWYSYISGYLMLVSGGTNSAIPLVAGYQGFYSSSLAANGDVVYATGVDKDTPEAVFRYRGGTNSLIVGDVRVRYSAVGTDGSTIVYFKQDGLLPFDQRYTAMFASSTETILASNSYYLSGPIINQGWIAFTAYDPFGAYQIWTRSPTGIVAQQTFFGASSDIVALAPNGEVVFLSSGRLYLARNNSLPLDLGAWNFWNSGRVYWQGRWYFHLGRSLFVLSPPLICSAGWQNGKFKLTVAGGTPGDTVIVQSSTNLAHWSSIFTNILTDAGFEFLDPASATAPGIVYRAVVH